MPNPWTGIGNPYTRSEVVERLNDTLTNGHAIIAAGAGSGISAKFIEKGGADLIIIYNSGRSRMMGHGTTAGLMSYGDANAIAMEIGEYEVLPVVNEIPVICGGVHATDPRRRMWHWLGKVKGMGFSGVNNFPTLVFAATGAGGRTMEALIESGMVAGVLDLTTTEWADELVGGVTYRRTRENGCCRQGRGARGDRAGMPGDGELRRTRLGSGAILRAEVLHP